jgi:hypothetical protein
MNPLAMPTAGQSVKNPDGSPVMTTCETCTAPAVVTTPIYCDPDRPFWWAKCTAREYNKLIDQRRFEEIIGQQMGHTS